MIPLARSSGPLQHTPPPAVPTGSLALAAAVAAQAGVGALSGHTGRAVGHARSRCPGGRFVGA